MKTLEAEFRPSTSTPPVRTTLQLPAAAPDLPTQLNNPLGHGRWWRLVSPAEVRPAVYEEIG